MPFLALDAVSRRLSEIKRGVTVFRGYLVGAVFQPAVFIVGEVQHFPVDERHAVHDDVTMNVILVRVRGNDVLIVGKRLLRQLLRQAVRFFGSDVILRVKAVLEVIILPAIKLLRLTIQLGGFGKLSGIVAVIIERIRGNDSGFLFIGDVVDRLGRFALAAATFE